jgi:hypothetical protein
MILIATRRSDYLVPQPVNKLDTYSRVMHAMTSVLVLDDEVLACMSEAGDKASQALLVASRINQGMDTADEHGDLYEMDVPQGKMKVANPQAEERDVLSGSNYFSCVSVDAAGTNHWSSILRSEVGGWYYRDK